MAYLDMFNLGRVVCAIKRSHLWRKAHKSEDQSVRHCSRCPATRPIVRRKRKEEQPHE